MGAFELVLAVIFGAVFPAAVIALVLWAYFAKRRRRSDPFCPFCGHDLLSLAEVTCPKCGEDLRPREDDENDIFRVENRMIEALEAKTVERNDGRAESVREVARAQTRGDSD